VSMSVDQARYECMVGEGDHLGIVAIMGNPIHRMETGNTSLMDP